MAVLHVQSGRIETLLDFVPGASLREVLHQHRIWTVSYCGGDGSCGRCRVRIDGPPGDLSPAEMARLSPADRERGVRLACQLHPRSDLRVTLDALDPQADWREFLSNGPLADVADGAPPEWSAGEAPLGVAIDLGTTHLRVSLWDVAAGRVVGRRMALNPQLAFGANVLSRLVTAHESPGHAEDMHAFLVDTLGVALPRLAEAAGRPTSAIGRVVLVGNTSMLALATKSDCADLLDPDGWTRPFVCERREDLFVRGWQLHPAARVEFVAPLAGFVGSDLVAAVQATRLCEGAPGALLIDFGTNSEVAYWDGVTLWVTSAAGGPAFEGSGTSCGMPAVPGAIRRATLTQGVPASFQTEVIGGGPGEGLSGSGLVDVIAALTDGGLLTAAGNFARERTGPSVVVQADPPVVLTRRDVDAFQRAKAAIGAAIVLLLERPGGNAPLSRVCVCGAFGEHLDVAHAQRVGLLPPVPPGLVELHGQAALAGAERWLLGSDPERAVADIAARARVLNLAHDAAYEGRFVDQLRLRPMTVEARRC